MSAPTDGSPGCCESTKEAHLFGTTFLSVLRFQVLIENRLCSLSYWGDKSITLFNSACLGTRGPLNSISELWRMTPCEYSILAMQQQQWKCVVWNSIRTGQSVCPEAQRVGPGEARSEPGCLAGAPIWPSKRNSTLFPVTPAHSDELVSRALGKLLGWLLCKQPGCPNQMTNKADLRALA